MSGQETVSVSPTHEMEGWGEKLALVDKRMSRQESQSCACRGSAGKRE